MIIPICILELYCKGKGDEHERSNSDGFIQRRAVL